MAKFADPEALFDRMAVEGFMGLCVPEEYGGAGMDFLDGYQKLWDLTVVAHDCTSALIRNRRVSGVAVVGTEHLSKGER